MSSTRKIKLIATSMAGEVVEFQVEEDVALQSETLKPIIEEGLSDEPTTVPNVAAETLARVIEYCKKHVPNNKVDEDNTADGAADEELKQWDSSFVGVHHSVLYDLLMAANYLNIKGLLDLVVRTVADKIRGKSPEEIRRILDIENDFTPEEEAAIRSENPWAFESSTDRCSSLLI